MLIATNLPQPWYKIFLTKPENGFGYFKLVDLKFYVTGLPAGILWRQPMLFHGIACCVTHLYFLFLWQHLAV